MSAGRRFLSNLCALGLLTLCVFVTGRASASPSAKLVYIRGVGAERCPTEPVLRRAVAVRLGYDPFFPQASKSVVAEVSASSTGDGFHARVQIVADDGTVHGARELAVKGDDCGELMTALALAISIGIDDLDDAKKEAAPPPAETAAVEPPRSVAPIPTSEKDAPPAPVLAPPPKKSLEWRVRFGPTVSIGAAPAPSVGAALGGDARSGFFALRLDLRGDLPASEGIAPTGKVATTSFLATVAPCVRGDIPFVCVFGGAGYLWSKTEGLVRNASDGATLFVAGARFGTDFALGDTFYLEAFGDIFANLTPHRVVIDNNATVFSLSAGGATAGLQLGARFF